MTVTITENAARHVAGFIGRRGKGIGVRLAVKNSGCSGLAYKLEYADEKDRAAALKAEEAERAKTQAADPVRLISDLVAALSQAQQAQAG